MRQYRTALRGIEASHPSVVAAVVAVVGIGIVIGWRMWIGMCMMLIAVVAAVVVMVLM